MSRPISVVSNHYRSLSFKLIKWTLVALIALHILGSIWTGIYMTKAVKEAENEYPDEVFGSSGADRARVANIWKGFLIAVLVIANLVNIMGVFAALKEHYWLCMAFGIALMAYSLFTAALYYTRGCYSSWILSFLVAILAFVYSHKIRVEVIAPTVYSAAPKV